MRSVFFLLMASACLFAFVATECTLDDIIRCEREIESEFSFFLLHSPMIDHCSMLIPRCEREIFIVTCFELSTRGKGTWKWKLPFFWSEKIFKLYNKSPNSSFFFAAAIEDCLHIGGLQDIQVFHLYTYKRQSNSRSSDLHQRHPGSNRLSEMPLRSYPRPLPVSNCCPLNWLKHGIDASLTCASSTSEITFSYSGWCWWS